MQRVMRELWNSFDAVSLAKLIARKFKVPQDELLWDVAQRITEIHCNCEGYSDDTIATLLEHVMTREPLPLDQRILHDLPRYKHVGEPKFRFVIQPHQSCLSLLVFVDKQGARVARPKGITMHCADGSESPALDETCPFVWMETYELRYNGKRVLRLKPQCSRVSSKDVVEC